MTLVGYKKLQQFKPAIYLDNFYSKLIIFIEARGVANCFLQSHPRMVRTIVGAICDRARARDQKDTPSKINNYIVYRRVADSTA